MIHLQMHAENKTTTLGVAKQGMIYYQVHDRLNRS